MVFCVNCGQALATAYDSENRGGAQGAECPSCGKPDELGQAFCVHCGAQLAPASTLSRPRAVARPVLSPGAAAARSKPAVAPKARMSLRSLVAGAVAAGIIMGALLACVAFQYGLADFVAPAFWPRHGLVIYSTQPEAQVVVAERSGKAFTLGKTGKNGALSIPELPAGLYRLTLSAPGRLPVVKDIAVDPDQALVLGYPKRIELPAER